jgi:hypothetical protein
MLDTIESDVVYDHDKHGEVLVSSVGKMYSKYPLNSSTEPVADSTVVYFHNRFDGYGGLNPSPLSEPVSDFAKQAEQVRAHERVSSDLMEE